MTALEILEEHEFMLTGDVTADEGTWKTVCSGCDWCEPFSDASLDLHQRHVATVLDEHIREARAQELEDMANILESRLAGHTRESGQTIAGRGIIREIRDRAGKVRTQL
ncbi:hypothetical protein [Glutamicibacter ardleyensis]|uniref:Oxidoreductase n=1 Tax=Glutamicibacter ardleyensis TaxID=225894 RepID=A0ABQ2DFV2_9MICC|nr:hypothetical protein [Glutamicibacter ardleyensis]GGJ55824.1 hypothetical protein GCM10007173_13320 [Glutamicibacter ardleyensis]